MTEKVKDNNMVSIAFTGDIGFDHYMSGKWNDDELLSGDIVDFLNCADHVVANVEGPLSVQEFRPEANSVLNLMHTMNPEVTKVLRRMNADIWNINNNHIMDAGEKGVADTLEEARKFGARTVGAGMNIKEAAAPLFIDGAGGIGMFTVGYRRGCKPAAEDRAGCLLWTEMDIIQKNIDDIKKKCRWCVLIVHGGEEFTSLPSPYTRDRYLKFLEMGADIIVAHHPHVPMNYETVGDKVIFYSLGNFIFDTDYQRAQFNTEDGIIIRLDFTYDSYSFEAMGIRIDRNDERIKAHELPKIFCDVDADNYEKLAPLSAKAFVAATKRQQIYLNPEEYKDATEEKWKEHFANPRRSGRVEGEALDFFIVCPLAEKAEEGAWKTSTLEEVKDYILRQI